MGRREQVGIVFKVPKTGCGVWTRAQLAAQRTEHLAGGVQCGRHGMPCGMGGTRRRKTAGRRSKFRRSGVGGFQRPSGVQEIQCAYRQRVSCARSVDDSIPVRSRYRTLSQGHCIQERAETSVSVWCEARTRDGSSVLRTKAEIPCGRRLRTLQKT